MSARLQSWFPFNVQICLNGREWLATQFRRRGRSDFKRVDNCFTWLGNPERAQRLMDEQLATDWPRSLDAIARLLNPLHTTIFKPSPMQYYWTAYQTEWATDLLFKGPHTLAEIHPSLVRHAMEPFKSPDVMRFLGRKAHGNFTGEVTTSFKNRPEGVRVKHWVRGHSIKMYDKAGSVLRVETTIAQNRDFKVLRPAHDDPHGKLEWRSLRKGVADLHRRAQRSNDAYLDALAAIDDTTPCAKLFDTVSSPAGARSDPEGEEQRDEAEGDGAIALAHRPVVPAASPDREPQHARQLREGGQHDDGGHQGGLEPRHHGQGKVERAVRDHVPELVEQGPLLRLLPVLAGQHSVDGVQGHAEEEGCGDQQQPRARAPREGEGGARRQGQEGRGHRHHVRGRPHAEEGAVKGRSRPWKAGFRS